MKKLFFFLSFFYVLIPQLNAQWSEQYSGDSVIFKSVSAVDNNVAWICGDIQRVFRTTNGGTNWIRCSTNNLPYPISLVNIFGIDQNRALVVGTLESSVTYAFRTTNAGTTWTQVFSQPSGFINSILMSDSQNGVMMGDPVNGRWSLWKTSNGGASWDSSGMYLQADGKEYSFLNCMYSAIINDQNFIWFGTSNNRVYHTTNNGVNGKFSQHLKINILGQFGLKMIILG